ncbi:DUF2520 domain-containing protein [Altibacter sp.]|uniref:Rossmann-like and DUF2520 domain-containing protein n=1 Tax=Altibacter sp. TaxID=2024823 RepID=UPI000C8B4828|nr:DUF2520 domain-containing protein [Altibacter sp.]MAP53450.1 hypothetical protein [Altibacter sp.]
MITVTFLGFGNVNRHLCSALHEIDQVSIKQIYNRSDIQLPSELKDIPFTRQLSLLEPADVYIIGIPDDAIASFSEALPVRDQLVVHTSGGVPMDSLSEKNRKGVFYPLQTFSKHRTVDFNSVPICIEASKDRDRKLLQQLASPLTKRVVSISSEERAKLHLAAVFVNNFVNHMYAVGADITSRSGLSFELLKPLIAETARKIEDLAPSEAQTGPAKRKDLNTIEKHVHLLQDSNYKEIYTLLTESIQKTHGKKL